jgi:hypothetical protein
MYTQNEFLPIHIIVNDTELIILLDGVEDFVLPVNFLFFFYFPVWRGLQTVKCELLCKVAHVAGNCLLQHCSSVWLLAVCTEKFN